MEPSSVWQAVVLMIQILLLAVGWVLFQQARSELSARAAETPILSEVKALQRNVKQLLADIEAAGDTVTQRVALAAREAADLAALLESRIDEAEQVVAALRDGQVSTSTSAPPIQAVSSPPTIQATAPPPPPTPAEERKRKILTLADAGSSVLEIAKQTGHSEGEVEMLLALRNHPRVG